MSLSTGSPAADVWLGTMTVVTVTGLFVLGLIALDYVRWLNRLRRALNKRGDN